MFFSNPNEQHQEQSEELSEAQPVLRLLPVDELGKLEQEQALVSQMGEMIETAEKTFCVLLWYMRTHQDQATNEKILKKLKLQLQDEKFDVAFQAIQDIDFTKSQEALKQLETIFDKHIRPLDVQDMMKQSKLEENDEVKNKDSVVLVGLSGAGKSTLAHLLMGSTMAFQQGRLRVTKTTGIDRFEIGHGRSSQTEHVSSAAIKDESLVVSDTPGFNDTRGGALAHIIPWRICNSQQGAKSLRIVVVVKSGWFDGRADSIIETFNYVAKLLKNMGHESILFVINGRNATIDENTIKDELANILKERKESLDPMAQSLLGYFRDHTKQVMFIVGDDLKKRSFFSARPDVRPTLLAKVKALTPYDLTRSQSFPLHSFVQDKFADQVRQQLDLYLQSIESSINDIIHTKKIQHMPLDTHLKIMHQLKEKFEKLSFLQKIFPQMASIYLKQATECLQGLCLEWNKIFFLVLQHHNVLHPISDENVTAIHRIFGYKYVFDEMGQIVERPERFDEETKAEAGSDNTIIDSASPELLVEEKPVSLYLSERINDGELNGFIKKMHDMLLRYNRYQQMTLLHHFRMLQQPDGFLFNQNQSKKESSCLIKCEVDDEWFKPISTAIEENEVLKKINIDDSRLSSHLQSFEKDLEAANLITQHVINLLSNLKNIIDGVILPFDFQDNWQDYFKEQEILLNKFAPACIEAGNFMAYFDLIAHMYQVLEACQETASEEDRQFLKEHQHQFLSALRQFIQPLVDIFQGDSLSSEEIKNAIYRSYILSNVCMKPECIQVFGEEIMTEDNISLKSIIYQVWGKSGYDAWVNMVAPSTEEDKEDEEKQAGDNEKGVVQAFFIRQISELKQFLRENLDIEKTNTFNLDSLSKLDDKLTPIFYVLSLHDPNLFEFDDSITRISNILKQAFSRMITVWQQHISSDEKNPSCYLEIETYLDYITQVNWLSTFDLSETCVNLLIDSMNQRGKTLHDYLSEALDGLNNQEPMAVNVQEQTQKMVAYANALHAIQTHLNRYLTEENRTLIATVLQRSQAFIHERLEGIKNNFDNKALPSLQGQHDSTRELLDSEPQSSHNDTVSMLFSKAGPAEEKNTVATKSFVTFNQSYLDAAYTYVNRIKDMTLCQQDATDVHDKIKDFFTNEREWQSHVFKLGIDQIKHQFIDTSGQSLSASLTPENVSQIVKLLIAIYDSNKAYSDILSPEWEIRLHDEAQSLVVTLFEACKQGISDRLGNNTDSQGMNFVITQLVEKLGRLIPFDDNILPNTGAYRNQSFSLLYNAYKNLNQYTQLLSKPLQYLKQQQYNDFISDYDSQRQEEVRLLLMNQADTHVMRLIEHLQQAGNTMLANNTVNQNRITTFSNSYLAYHQAKELIATDICSQHVKTAYKKARSTTITNINTWIQTIKQSEAHQLEAKQFKEVAGDLMLLNDISDQRSAVSDLFKETIFPDVLSALNNAFEKAIETAIDTVLDEASAVAKYHHCFVSEDFTYDKYDSTKVAQTLITNLLERVTRVIQDNQQKLRQQSITPEKMLAIIYDQYQLVSLLNKQSSWYQQILLVCRGALEILDEQALTLDACLQLQAAIMQQPIADLKFDSIVQRINQEISSQEKCVQEKLASNEFPGDALDTLQKIANILPNHEAASRVYAEALTRIEKKNSEVLSHVSVAFNALKENLEDQRFSAIALCQDLNYLIDFQESKHLSRDGKIQNLGALKSLFRHIHSYFEQNHKQFETALKQYDGNQVVLTLRIAHDWHSFFDICHKLELAVKKDEHEEEKHEHSDDTLGTMTSLAIPCLARQLFESVQQEIDLAAKVQITQIRAQGLNQRQAAYENFNKIVLFLSVISSDARSYVDHYRQQQSNLATDLGLEAFKKAIVSRLTSCYAAAKTQLLHDFLNIKDWEDFNLNWRELTAFTNRCGNNVIFSTLQCSVSDENKKTPLLGLVNELSTILDEKIEKTWQTSFTAYNPENPDSRLALIEFFVSVQQLINQVPQFSEQGKQRVQICLKAFNEKYGAAQLKLLGTRLQEHQSGLGLALMDQQDIFKGLAIALRNTQTAARDIDFILDNLRCRQSNGQIVTADDELREKLKKEYDSFTQIYSGVLDKYLSPELDFNVNAEKHLSDLKKELETLIKTAKDGLDDRNSDPFAEQRVKEVIPYVLAYLFAIWTLRDSKAYFSNSDDQDRNVLKKPHAAQVVAIFLKLNIAGEHGVINHLTEVLTGEGKSIVVAVQAACTALLGYDQECVCYSQYLSVRDEADFDPFFKFLGVKQHIRYGTFNHLLEQQVNRKGDLRALMRARLLGETLPEEKQSSSDRKTILSIDETDVFFSEAFYGSLYQPMITLQFDEMTQLINMIWDKHCKKQALTLDMLKATQEYEACLDKMKQYQQLLENSVHNMLIDLGGYQKDQGHNYELSERGHIIYAYQDGTSDKITKGYLTLWAYFHESKKGNIDRSVFKEQVGLQVSCGLFPYSDLLKKQPYQAILGVTGTLADMSDVEREVVAQEFNINSQTFLPSAFGSKELESSSRKDYTLTIADDDVGYFSAIMNGITRGRIPTRTQESKQESELKRPVLIFFKDEAALQHFYHSREFHDFQSVANIITETSISTDAEQNSKIIAATQPGAITLITEEYARGRDFVCNHPGVNANGGMHGIQTYMPQQESTKRQIDGRVGRRGEDCSREMIVHKKQFQETYRLPEDPANVWNYFQWTWDSLRRRRDACFTAHYKKRKANINQVNMEYYQSSMQLATMLQGPSQFDGEQFAKLVAAVNPANSRKPKSTRTVIMLDGTASMSGVLNGVKDIISNLLTDLADIFLKYGLDPKEHQVQLIIYRNFNVPTEEHLAYSQWERITEKGSQLKRFIQAQKDKGGLHCEAMHVGFNYLNWQMENNQYAIDQVVIIGDMPPKGVALDSGNPLCCDFLTGREKNKCAYPIRDTSTFKENWVLGNNYSQALATLKEKGVTVHTRLLKTKNTGYLNDSIEETRSRGKEIKIKGKDIKSVSDVYQHISDSGASGGTSGELVLGRKGKQNLYTLFGGAIIEKATQGVDPSLQKNMLKELSYAFRK